MSTTSSANNNLIPGYTRFVEALHSFYKQFTPYPTMQQLQEHVHQKVKESESVSSGLQLLTQQLKTKYKTHLHLSSSSYFRWDEYKRPATNAYKELMSSLNHVQRESNRRQKLGLSETADEQECLQREAQRKEQHRQATRRRRLGLPPQASEQECKDAERQKEIERRNELERQQKESERQNQVDARVKKEIFDVCLEQTTQMLARPGNHTKEVLCVLKELDAGDISVDHDIQTNAQSLILHQINHFCLTYEARDQRDQRSSNERYDYDSDHYLYDDRSPESSLVNKDLYEEVLPESLQVDEKLKQHIYVRIKQIVQRASLQVMRNVWLAKSASKSLTASPSQTESKVEQDKREREQMERLDTQTPEEARAMFDLHEKCATKSIVKIFLEKAKDEDRKEDDEDHEEDEEHDTKESSMKRHKSQNATGSSPSLVTSDAAWGCDRGGYTLPPTIEIEIVGEMETESVNQPSPSLGPPPVLVGSLATILALKHAQQNAVVLPASDVDIIATPAQFQMIMEAMTRNSMKFVRRNKIDRKKEGQLLKQIKQNGGPLVLTNKERKERREHINKYNFGTSLKNPHHMKVFGESADGHYAFDNTKPSSSKMLLEWAATWANEQTDGHNMGQSNSSEHSLCPSNNKDLHLCWSWFDLTPDCRVAVPPLSVLASMKYAHLIFNIQWQKHAESFQILRPFHCIHGGETRQGIDSIGDDVKEILKAFETLRRSETAHRIGADAHSKKLNLNVSNQEFFKMHFLQEMMPLGLLKTRLVPGCSIYTHDEIHKMVALTKNQPIYKIMKHDQTKAMLDKELFFQADFQTRINLVREEAMAIACERVILPELLHCHGRQQNVAPFREHDIERAYAKGLCWTLTRLSKGWFRTFGLLHYEECQHCPRDDLVQIFVNDGRLLLFPTPANVSSTPNCGGAGKTEDVESTKMSDSDSVDKLEQQKYIEMAQENLMDLRDRIQNNLENADSRGNQVVVPLRNQHDLYGKAAQQCRDDEIGETDGEHKDDEAKNQMHSSVAKYYIGPGPWENVQNWIKCGGKYVPYRASRRESRAHRNPWVFGDKPSTTASLSTAPSSTASLSTASLSTASSSAASSSSTSSSKTTSHGIYCTHAPTMFDPSEEDENDDYDDEDDTDDDGCRFYGRFPDTTIYNDGWELPRRNQEFLEARLLSVEVRLPNSSDDQCFWRSDDEMKSDTEVWRCVVKAIKERHRLFSDGVVWNIALNKLFPERIQKEVRFIKMCLLRSKKELSNATVSNSVEFTMLPLSIWEGNIMPFVIEVFEQPQVCFRFLKNHTMKRHCASWELIGLLNNARVTRYQQKTDDCNEECQTELTGPSGNTLVLKKSEWTVMKREIRPGHYCEEEMHQIVTGDYSLKALVVDKNGNTVKGTSCDVLETHFNKVIGSFSNVYSKQVNTTALQMGSAHFRTILSALGLRHTNEFEFACVMLSLNEMNGASEARYNGWDWMKEVEHFDCMEELGNCSTVKKCMFTEDGVKESLDVIKIWALHNYCSL